MKKDIRIMNNFYKFGRVLGVSSIWHDSTNNGNVILYRMYIIFLIILAIIGTIWSIHGRYHGFWRQIDITQKILETFMCLAEMAFLLSCFLTSLLKGKDWQDLNTHIHKIDKILSREHLQVSTKNYWHLIKIILLHLIYVGLHVFEILVWIKIEDSGAELGYILSRVIMYYQFYVTMMIITITDWFKTRYNFTGKLLKQLIDKKKQIILISQDNNKLFVEELIEIKHIYAKLNQAVKQFNTLFGWPIFLNNVSNVLVCLVNINYVKFANTGDSNFSVGIYINTGIYTAVYSVNLYSYAVVMYT